METNEQTSLEGVSMASTTGTSTITRPERIVRESAVIAQLRDMIHIGWAETGIDDVWAAARRGLGRLLVVEFVAPGSLSDIGRIGLLVGKVEVIP